MTQVGRSGIRRLGTALALAVMPVAGLADHAPCLTVQPGLSDYATAFAAEGWQAAEGERRRVALNTLAEAQVAAALMPTVSGDAQLRAFLANARGSWAPVFDRTEVLVKGDAAVGFWIEAADTGNSLRCVIAGPRLEEVEHEMTAGLPDRYGDIRFVATAPAAPEGAAALTVSYSRAVFAVGGVTDFRGVDGIFVTLTLPPR